MKKRLIVKCDHCNKTLEKFSRDKRNKHHFCDRSCKNKWQSLQKLSEETKKKISYKTRGENNGMFGKKHSDDTKKKISDAANQHYLDNPELKYICGNSRLPKETRSIYAKNTHRNRLPESYRHFPSDETKRKIGQKSKQKFTPEYKKRIRKSLEEKGLIIPLEKKDDYILYKDFSNWIKKMFDIISNEKELFLLAEHGVWNYKTNKGGVVRDHKYSRYSGWKNGVFPEILRHPVNCEIILQKDNIKKKRGRYEDTDSQTLDELFNRIKEYKGTWEEQNICIALIEKYNNGERYKKEEYITKFYAYEK